MNVWVKYSNCDILSYLCTVFDSICSPGFSCLKSFVFSCLRITQKQLNKTKFMLPLERTSVTQKSKVGCVLDIVPSIKTHICSLSQHFPPPLCWNVTGNNEILAMNVFWFFSTMIIRLLEQNQKITCVCVSGLYLVYISLFKL